MTERFQMGDETFRDAATGREWAREMSEPMTLSAANEYAAHCRTGGHADWRVPECDELLTLVDRARYNPATWPELRTITPSDWFWTATPYAPSSGGAWVVYFGSGDAYGGGVSASRRVRCVR